MNTEKYMFQYALGRSFGKKPVIEDTGLIDFEEAKKLWDTHYKDFISNLELGNNPQMCIWQDCTSITDYSNVLKEMDYRDDYEIINGEYYKIVNTKTKIV